MSLCIMIFWYKGMLPFSNDMIFANYRPHTVPDISPDLDLDFVISLSCCLPTPGHNHPGVRIPVTDMVSTPRDKMHRADALS